MTAKRHEISCRETALVLQSAASLVDVRERRSASDRAYCVVVRNREAAAVDAKAAESVVGLCAKEYLSWFTFHLNFCLTKSLSGE